MGIFSGKKIITSRRDRFFHLRGIHCKPWVGPKIPKFIVSYGPGLNLIDIPSTEEKHVFFSISRFKTSYNKNIGQYSHPGVSNFYPNEESL